MQARIPSPMLVRVKPMCALPYTTARNATRAVETIGAG